MQKICFVLPNLDYQGSVRQVCLLAPIIAREGFQVEVVSLAGSGPFSSSLRDSGITVHEFETPRLLDLNRWLAPRRIFRRLQPDLVHLWGYSTLDALRLAWLGDWEQFPKMLLSPGEDSWNAIRSNWWSKRSFRHVSRVIANFESEKLRLESSLPAGKEIEIVPPAVNTHLERNSSKEIRKSLHLPEDAKLILCTGHMNQMEPLRDAVWGFDVLRYVFKNVYLLMVGDGPARLDLYCFGRANAPDDYRIHYLGYRSDLRELMQVVDIIWVPLRQPGGTNVILEAMAAKRPVVATAMPNTISLIEHDKTGILVHSKQATEFTRVTKNLLEEPQKAREMGLYAHQYVTEHHNPQNIARKLCSIYDGAKI